LRKYFNLPALGIFKNGVEVNGIIGCITFVGFGCSSCPELVKRGCWFSAFDLSPPLY
jgi:hypothetical protein